MSAGRLPIQRSTFIATRSVAMTSYLHLCASQSNESWPRSSHPLSRRSRLHHATSTYIAFAVSFRPSATFNITVESWSASTVLSGRPPKSAHQSRKEDKNLVVRKSLANTASCAMIKKVEKHDLSFVPLNALASPLLSQRSGLNSAASEPQFQFSRILFIAS